MTGPVQHLDPGIGQGRGEPPGGLDRDDHVVRVRDQQYGLRHRGQGGGQAGQFADPALLGEEAAPQRPTIA